MLKFKKFDEFKFEVIDVTIQGTPDIIVNLNKITFTKKVIEDMGYPPFICAMIDAENKAFAIKGCKAEGENTFKFSKPRASQTSAISMSSRAILRLLRAVMRDEWDKEHRYRLTGVYFPESKAMVFDLNEAKGIPISKDIKSKER